MCLPTLVRWYSLYSSAAEGCGSSLQGVGSGLSVHVQGSRLESKRGNRTRNTKGQRPRVAASALLGVQLLKHGACPGGRVSLPATWSKGCTQPLAHPRLGHHLLDGIRVDLHHVFPQEATQKTTPPNHEAGTPSGRLEVSMCGGCSLIHSAATVLSSCTCCRKKHHAFTIGLLRMRPSIQSPPLDPREIYEFVANVASHGVVCNIASQTAEIVCNPVHAYKFNLYSGRV